MQASMRVRLHDGVASYVPVANPMSPHLAEREDVDDVWARCTVVPPLSKHKVLICRDRKQHEGQWHGDSRQQGER